MRRLADRAWFRLCLTLGRLLRASTYSKTRIASRNGERVVEKRRSFYAPLLISMGDILLRFLDAGVRILQQRDWEERERTLYQSLHDAPIRIAPGGTLVLPCLAGETLATILANPELAQSGTARAIELAVAALAELHRRGFTHGDAMAENVIVDLEAGKAHWIDFETIHDPSREMVWRRADDLRALLATCLLRTSPEALSGTCHLIVDGYRDDAVARRMAGSFTAVWRRPLIFHLGQAPMSFQSYREIGRLLGARRGH